MNRSQKSDDEKRDEVLKRMLNTPHKPHTPLKKKQKSKRRKTTKD